MENKNIKETTKIMKNSANNMNDNMKKQSNTNMTRNFFTLIFVALIIGLIGYSYYIRTVDFNIDTNTALSKAIEDTQAKAIAEAQTKAKAELERKEAELRRLLIERENKRVSGIKADYKELFAEIIMEAESNIEKNLTSNISKAKGLAKDTAEKFRSFSVLKDILWYQSKDFAFDSNEAGSYMENLVGTSLIESCANTQALVSSSLDFLVIRLNEEANNMHSDLIEGVPEQLKTPEYEASLSDIVREIYTSIYKAKGSSLSLGLNSGALVLETVGLFFGRKSFNAMVSKAVAGIGLAVLDGPLPIGDILTGLSFAWIAWDLYDLTDEAAVSIKADLDSSLDSFENELKASAKKNIEEIRTQIEASNA